MKKEVNLYLVLFIVTTSTVVYTQLNFTCDNGESIPLPQFCDSVPHCSDGSDEIYTELNCSDCDTTKISCQVRQLSCFINADYICDRSVKCVGLNPCDAGCPQYYRCLNGSCEPRSTVCDGDSCNGCPEEDGWRTGTGFQCRRSGRRCRLPQQLLYDEIPDCDQREDLCYKTTDPYVNRNISRDIRGLPSTTFDDSLCFECLDKSTIIPLIKVCDRIINCPDLSDECLCSGNIPPICNAITLRTYTPSLSGQNLSCEVGQFRCGNGSCFNRTSVCDSISDCPDNRDERFRYCRGTLLCSNGHIRDQGDRCRCSTPCKNFIGTLCNGIGDCPPTAQFDRWVEPPGFPADECAAQCTNSPRFNCTKNTKSAFTPFGMAEEMQFCKARNHPSDPMPGSVRNITVYTEQICDGIPHCNINREDERDYFGRYYCQAGIKISIEDSKVCDGIIDCDDGSDETMSTCPERFFCSSLDGTKVSIESDFVCNFIVNCDNAEDELNCTDERFYCEDGGEPLFVRERQVFDGRPDCSDSSDECPTILDMNEDDVFSSRYQLIDSPLLKVLVWIMGLLALSGNLVVIIVECRNLYKMKGNKISVPFRTNLSLILNLAVADMLMGIYLIALGVATVMFDGEFCLHNLTWRSGFACRIMGSLVVISSETSVITLTYLAGIRLFAVFKPFLASRKPSMRTLIIMISISWMIPLLLALLPFTNSLQYLFADIAVMPDNPFFRNVTVNLDEAKSWAVKLLTYDSDLSGSFMELFYLIRDAPSWRDLQSSVGNAVPAVWFKITGFIGYYSANSVCIPRFFVTRDDKAWQFSIAVTTINFLAFIFVATAYFVIIIKTRKKMLVVKNSTVQSGARDLTMEAMQRKIYRLVATDFCCWVPITIMAFINFSGTIVPDIAYVIAAIVLLPINSALNPLLYSGILGKILKKIIPQK